jgi:endonuclease III
MNKKDRVDHILNELERLFPETPIPLDHTDAYTLLIAVLLSAQCTDVRVNQITPKLFKLANTPQAMAKIKVSVIEDIVRPCGLAPRKAKAISELSKMIINIHGGEVPGNFSDLEAMPGVGHKTASVVMAQAFNHPAFPVDTHIHRLAQQWGLTSGKNVVQTEKDLKRLFPEDSWNKLHLQFIFYGREYCQARGCNGLRCDMCQTVYPNRKKEHQYLKA